MALSTKDYGHLLNVLHECKEIAPHYNASRNYIGITFDTEEQKSAWLKSYADREFFDLATRCTTLGYSKFIQYIFD